MSCEHVSLELRPKTSETVSSAYKEGRLTSNGGDAAWEPTSSDDSDNDSEVYFTLVTSNSRVDEYRAVVE